MAKEKNKPVPVRFDLELLKEEEKIDTPQQALNFLAKFWENNRPAKDDFLSDAGGVRAEAKAPVTEGKKREASSPSSGQAMAHPSGLSGIDLSIWKAEQKEKNKNA